MKTLHMAAFVLTVVGALNWALTGLFQLDLIYSIFGGMGLSGLIYILVGASAVYLGMTHKGDCKICGAK